ncbi:tetratricopeptide repeat protein [Alysiella filiformis]|uniref:TolA-binding protein n=1 Tax=Alysiella filiformis DSM 16848 TaxID=1120981 RepID=A0A286EK15_9NEIS|nr:hypothetical protein [Alysiella filiformis]QMT30704.1 hypothetical protein H3L97_08115 [Alysiella filiformis]UBQ56316.1 hypothetical protein JF568_00565 [Alysiella filiformis DSM 16848]SOD71159.1 TolA-binding protein [Alysiella filiformis DSM 16848]
MFKKIIILFGLVALNACATSSPNNATPNSEMAVQAASEVLAAPEIQAASDIAQQPESESLPYPTLDKQNQIDQLIIKINQLEEKMAQLNTRIRQLERHAQTPPPKVARPTPPSATKRKLLPEKTLTIKAQNHAPEQEDNPPPTVNPLQAAQNAYAQKQYHTVIEQLRGADSGGDGSPNAQQQMFLLLQSHLKLNHCQSVIQMGRHFASRFSGSPNAPQALFAVGQCQWQIQQRDIAKDTWRDIIRRYPQSPVAQAAAHAMKQK